MNKCYFHQSNWIIIILFFFLSVLTNAQNTTNWQLPYDTDVNTVALWHFDESAGKNVADAGPNNYDGVSTNTNITNSMNGFGNAREFVDSPTGYITFGDFNLPQFEGTLEYWVHPNTRPVTDCDHSHFFTKGTHGNSGNGFTFYNRLFNDTDADYGLGNNGGGANSRFENAFNYNEWQHIAFTWTTEETKMYVNGELISIMDPFPIGIAQSSDEVALGRWGSQLYTRCRYLGYVDELRISNVARVFEVVIPVELTSFYATLIHSNVTLNWTTSTETNNGGFEIQRKLDSSVWEKIGFIEGYGTTTEPKEYSYVDEISLINVSSLSYRLKQIDFDGSFEYSDEVLVEIQAPIDYALHQNFPNPYNPTTTIKYQIPNSGFVTLKVYDVLGNEVATLINENKEPGTYNITFDASSAIGGLSSGVYIYQLKINDYLSTKKMILMK